MSPEHAEHDVIQALNGWAAAELHGDAAYLERALVNDFVGIGPLGFMLTKQDWLARHQSGDLRYAAFTLDEVKVRMYGETALVTCRQIQQATYRGTNVPGQFRVSLVFVRQGEQWRLANLQLSAIGQPPTFTNPNPHPS